MNDAVQQLEARAISPGSVRRDGHLTFPRSYGVYEVPPEARNTRRFRFGNHPVRFQELEREFGRCRFLYLFEAREDAAAMVRQLLAQS